jgi:NADPH:quinone reductase-like Zn-dependent oxidoreductase
MKAVVLTEPKGPEHLQILEVDTPQPKPGEVRICLQTSALNRRDYWITLGKYPGMELPCIAGSDGAGIIEEVGSGVDPNLIGQEVVLYPARDWGESEARYGPNFRVLGMPDQGTFAEYICTPATDVYPKPKHLSWEQAAAVPLAGLTAWRSVVTHADVSLGEKVLVTGAGSGVSTFAILWCLNLGAEVYVTSSSKEKIDAAKLLGVNAGENYKDPECYKKLKTLSGGFNAVIDSAGGDALNSILDTLLPAGRYVFFGATLGNASKGLSMGKLFFNHTRIQGTTMGSNAEFGAMLNFLNEKKIVPVVDSILPLSEAIKAHKLMETFGHTGKIVLKNTL